VRPKAQSLEFTLRCEVGPGHILTGQAPPSGTLGHRQTPNGIIGDQVKAVVTGTEGHALHARPRTLRQDLIGQPEAGVMPAKPALINIHATARRPSPEVGPPVMVKGQDVTAGNRKV